jgi:hypothetical protein
MIKIEKIEAKVESNIKKHIWFYGSFVAIQLLGLWLVLTVSYDKHLQLMAMFITTVFYMFWALLHQYLHHHLSPRIVTEYVLTGSFGLVVSIFLFGV